LTRQPPNKHLQIKEKSAMAINEEKLHRFLGSAVTDFGAAMHAGLVVIGEKLGLYKAMKEAGGQITSAELAERTNTDERMAQRAGGRRLCIL
jgi:hypothetical protein